MSYGAQEWNQCSSMIPDNQKHLLLLCDYRADSASTIVDHVRAFPRYSQHRVWVLNRLGNLPPGLDLDRFDGIILHYSLVISYDWFLSKSARAAIRRFKGFKAVFIQDDYRWVNRTVSTMEYLRINAIFCLAPQDVVDLVYSSEILPGVRKITVLAGYVPEDLTRIEPKPYEARGIDVGYRARKLSAWIGGHAQEKWLIADRFLRDAPRYGLACDISYREEDRIYGDRWIEFLRDCRAVLGTESGSSVCDFTGEIQVQVEAHERREPDVDFTTLRELYFKDADGKVMMNIVSPRCFEAAALRTLMILYEGKYSGALVPWRHYVPLRKDHSNMDEVVAVLRNPDQWSDIVDRAYREVAQNPRYTFRAMVEEFDRVSNGFMSALPGRSAQVYDEAGFASASTLRGARTRGWRVVLGELGVVVERNLQALLVRLVSPLKNRRIRTALRRAYFAVTCLMENVYAITGELSGLLRVARKTGSIATFGYLWQLRLSFGRKVALLRELDVLVSAESLALDDDAFRLKVRTDTGEGILWVEGQVLGGSGASVDEPGGWDRIAEQAARGGIRHVRWRIWDEWSLAPRPRVPDEHEFPVLSAALRAQPHIALALIRQMLSRVITSPGSAAQGSAATHAA